MIGEIKTVKNQVRDKQSRLTVTSTGSKLFSKLFAFEFSSF
jgi:hypothetical protein